MTATSLDTSLPDVLPQSARVIVVGVRDLGHDAAALRWATADIDAAGMDDELLVVHAYLPIRLDDCTVAWVGRTRDARRLEAQRVLACASRSMRSARPDLLIEGTVVAGLAEDVLDEFSRVVDLIVIGDDDTGQAGDTPRRRRAVARRVRERAACPVVTVPPGWTAPSPDAPVVLLVGDDGLSTEALDFAAAWARRHGRTLEVSRTWSSWHEGAPTPSALAHHQEEFDEQLAEACARGGHVPVVARIELDDGFGGGFGGELFAHAALVVVAAGSPAAPDAAPCPVAVVPPEA